MAGGRAAERGGISYVVAVAMSLAAPVLAYAAVRNAALDAAGTGGDPSSTLPPQRVLPQLKALIRAARQPEARFSDGALDNARKGAVALPLAYEPYFIAARLEEQKGRYGRATILMEEARRRRPNATSIRVALLGYYSLADAYQKAIDEADVAMRINDRSRALILPAFAKLVSEDVRARQAIAVALAKRPPWRNAFLQAAAEAKMKPDVAKSLVEQVRKLAPSPVADAEEAFLVRSLVDAGEYQEAHALWESYRPPRKANANLIVDPDFRGLAAMAPFVWSFGSSQDGTAEIAKGSSRTRSLLEVDYFGDAELLLAEQMLAARPGRYSLSSLITGNSSALDVQLGWHVTCLPSGASLAVLQLQPLREAPVRRETSVVVPATGCSGQRLALLGQPGDISRTLSAQIFQVALVPAPSASRGR